MRLAQGGNSLKGCLIPSLYAAFSSRHAASRFGALGDARSVPPGVETGGGMAWIYLAFAGLFEVGWAVGLKFTQGFTRLWPSLWTLASMGLSLGLLGLALKSLPLGTAYAVWTGIGTIGTVLVGILVLGEPATVARIACVGLIVAGIAGLKILS
jgi:quaternary ammonium compound-resistance protein SugE